MSEIKKILIHWIKELSLYVLFLVLLSVWWLTSMVFFTEIWGRLVLIGLVVITVIYCYIDNKWIK
jgi:hypothetical protein